MDSQTAGFIIIVVLIISFFVIGSIVLLSIFLPKPMKNKMAELNGQLNKKGEGVFTVDGKTFIIKFFPGSRNRSPEFKISTLGDFPAELVIRNETSLDRFYKSIGLNSELSISDKELDERFYFECDIPEFLRQLLSNDETKPIILDISNSFNFIEISKNSCSFRKYPSPSLESFSAQMITDAARKMISLLRFVPSIIPMAHPEFDSFKFWSNILTGFGVGVLISGIIFFFWAGIFYRVVDGSRAWGLALEWSVSVFIVVGYFVFTKIKGFSVSSKVFIRFSILFSIGLLLSFRYGGAVYNGYFDKSRINIYEQVVDRKYTYTHKGTTSYYVVARPWREGRNGWAFTVSREQYLHINPGTSQCLIKTKAGSLGFEWIVFEGILKDATFTWVSHHYDNWFPLPNNANDMDIFEYEYFRKWRVIIEEGISNRMDVEEALGEAYDQQEMLNIRDEFVSRQRAMLNKLNQLDVPQRLSPFKEDILSAGEDQIRFYQAYVQARIQNRMLKINDFFSNASLKSSDQKLHEADNYFKSLYPSLDKAFYDAIERRVAWFDTV